MEDIKSSLEPIRLQLRENLQSVISLTKFDNALISIISTKLSSLSDRLKKHGIQNPKLLPDETIQMIDQIHEHNSLQINFKMIYNQSVVLAVSFLTSTLEDIFKKSVEFSLSMNGLQSEFLQREEVKINILDLLTLNESFAENLAVHLFERKGISFQDMQSTVRSFKNYLDIEIDKDENLRTLIFVQAARHIITHSRGVPTDKFWQQIETARPRILKQDFQESEINFSPEEIATICHIAEDFLDNIISKIYERFVVSE